MQILPGSITKYKAMFLLKLL